MLTQLALIGLACALWPEAGLGPWTARRDASRHEPEQDSTVPNHHARRLAEKLPRCRLTLLPCSHNDWAAQPQVRISLDDNP